MFWNATFQNINKRSSVLQDNLNWKFFHYIWSYFSIFLRHLEWVQERIMMILWWDENVESKINFCWTICQVAFFMNLDPLMRARQKGTVLPKIANMAVSELLHSPKLISRKIWVQKNSQIFDQYISILEIWQSWQHCLLYYACT